MAPIVKTMPDKATIAKVNPASLALDFFCCLLCIGIVAFYATWSWLGERILFCVLATTGRIEQFDSAGLNFYYEQSTSLAVWATLVELEKSFFPVSPLTQKAAKYSPSMSLFCFPAAVIV